MVKLHRATRLWLVALNSILTMIMLRHSYVTNHADIHVISVNYELCSYFGNIYYLYRFSLLTKIRYSDVPSFLTVYIAEFTLRFLIRCHFL